MTSGAISDTETAGAAGGTGIRVANPIAARRAPTAAMAATAVPTRITGAMASRSPPPRRRFPNHRLSMSGPWPSLETTHHVWIEPLRKIGLSAAIVPSAVNVAVAVAGAVGVAADVIAQKIAITPD